MGMSKHNATMQDLLNAKIDQAVSSIRFYMAEGIDKATAVSMVRKGSCLTDSIWATIESKAMAQ